MMAEMSWCHQPTPNLESGLWRMPPQKLPEESYAYSVYRYLKDFTRGVIIEPSP